jgi:hypothetical protein
MGKSFLKEELINIKQNKRLIAKLHQPFILKNYLIALQKPAKLWYHSSLR